MTLDQFNRLPAHAAADELLSVCGSRTWAERVAARRPFGSEEALQEASEEVWSGLPEADWLDAFSAHPRIGESRPATSAHLASSAAEQAAAQATLAAVADVLVARNHAYEARFGFRYLVFARGRSAPELLAVLESRLGNSREAELHEAARQQALITASRMERWLRAEDVVLPLAPPPTLSTHILDTSRGRPAAGVVVLLETRTDDAPVAWQLLAEALTDGDGRARMTPSGAPLEPGTYRLTFRTGAYFAERQQATLYPEVAITFNIQAGQAHYHIPLLLNPFGFTTYRGS